MPRQLLGNRRMLCGAHARCPAPRQLKGRFEELRRVSAHYMALVKPLESLGFSETGSLTTAGMDGTPSCGAVGSVLLILYETHGRNRDGKSRCMKRLGIFGSKMSKIEL